MNRLRPFLEAAGIPLSGAVSFESCLTAVVATVSNIGPGLGEVGPMGSFAHFTNFSKAVLTLDMLVGRLELFPLLMLFSPDAWKK